MPQQQPEPQYAPRKRTLAENIGLLADAFHGNNRHAQMQMAQDQQDYQRWADLQRQAQDFANWQRQYDYAATHPKPQGPTTFERDLQAAGIDPNSDQGRQLYQRYITNRADPFQSVPGVDAQGNQVLRFIRPSQMGGGTVQPPSTLPPDFDFGGPTPSASGGFP